jgi:enoyl-CoA hydratase
VSAKARIRSETRDGGIALVTLDRPRANAIDSALVDELHETVRKAAGARALVLASSQPLFSAGWDLPAIRGRSREEMGAFVSQFCDLIREIFSFEAPVLAALPGHAIAGGLILAATADERLAADGDGLFGLSEVPLGVPLPRPLFELFRHLLGTRGAERLAAAGDNVSAARALEMGLVDRVVAAEDLLEATIDRARQLCGRSRSAYAAVKLEARGEALERFDRARRDDPFLDFWFSEEAQTRIAVLVDRLTKKS